MAGKRRKVKPIVIIGVVAAGLLTAGGFAINTFIQAKKAAAAEAEANDFTLKPLTVDQLQGGKYYVKDGDTFYALPRGQFYSNVQNDTPIPKAANPTERGVMFGPDDEQIPTLYKDTQLVYKATDTPGANNASGQPTSTAPSEYILERFKDNGWSIGINGLKNDAGTGKYKTIISGSSVQKRSTLTRMKINPGSEVIIDKVGGVPITQDNISPMGSVIGLNRGQTYSVDAYNGTTYIGMDAIADTHMLSSYEVYSLKDYEMDPAGFLSVTVPDELWSGYYMVNGSGMFRYINRYKAEDSSDVDFNTAYYVGIDQNGNEVINPAKTGTKKASNTTQDNSNSSSGVTVNRTPTSTRELVWTSNFTIDNPQKVMNVQVTYSQPMAVVNGVLVTGGDEGTQIAGVEIPTAILTAPDGTIYDLETEAQNDKNAATNRLTTAIENPGTGTWIVTMKGMYARTFDVNAYFEGSSSNMVVKNGTQDAEMTVYLPEAVTNGIFVMTWDNKSHAGNFKVSQKSGEGLSRNIDLKLGNIDAPETIIYQTYGEVMFAVGNLPAGEYSIKISGEALGHVYFSFGDDNHPLSDATAAGIKMDTLAEQQKAAMIKQAEAFEENLSDDTVSEDEKAEIKAQFDERFQVTGSNDVDAAQQAAKDKTGMTDESAATQ